MYFITIDGGARLTGVYKSGISPEIPQDAIEVPDGEIAKVLGAERLGDWLYSAGAIVFDDAGASQRALSEGAADTWDAIKRVRDEKKAGGVLVGAKWYHSDDASRIQQLGLKDEARDMIAAGALPTDQMVIDGASVVWKTMDGSFVPMTAQLAIDIVAAVKVLDKRAFATAEMHRATMLASTSPAAYDYSAGWPEVFVP